MNIRSATKSKSDTAGEIRNSLPLFEHAITLDPHEVASRASAVNGLGRAACVMVSEAKDTSHLEMSEWFSVYGILESAYDDTIQAIWPEIQQGIDPTDAATYALMSTLSQRTKEALKVELSRKPWDRRFDYDREDEAYVIDEALLEKPEGKRCPMNNHQIFVDLSQHAKAVAIAAHDRGLKVQRFYKARQTFKYMMLSTDSERAAQRI